jgi:hypothetical protein
METSPTQRHPFQFSLRKLMLWTAVWSAYLEIVRWVGMLLPIAVLLTVCLAALLFVRLKWGYDNGIERAVAVSRSFCIVVVLIAALVTNVFGPIGALLAAIPLGYAIAAPVCICGYILVLFNWLLSCPLPDSDWGNRMLFGGSGQDRSLYVSVVASVVDWLNNLMETKPPQDE